MGACKASSLQKRDAEQPNAKSKWVDRVSSGVDRAATTKVHIVTFGGCEEWRESCFCVKYGGGYANRSNQRG